MALASAEDKETLEFANDWQGPGVILADATGTLPPGKAKHQLLSLPLRRDELLRCLGLAAGLVHSDDQHAHEAETIDQTASEPSLSILLVEDNQVNQLVATSLLKKLGHRADPAENGLKALQALENNHYDLVLMDCQMPVMDGYEATQRIRQNPQWQQLPIIAVTANVMQGDREDCLASGMNDYITKPYKREELRAVIERWRPSDSAEVSGR